MKGEFENLFSKCVPASVSCHPLTMKKSEIMPRVSKQPSSIQVRRQKQTAALIENPRRFGEVDRLVSWGHSLHTNGSVLLLGRWNQGRLSGCERPHQDGTFLTWFYLPTKIYLHKNTGAHTFKFLNNQKYLLSKQSTYPSSLQLAGGGQLAAFLWIPRLHFLLIISGALLCIAGRIRYKLLVWFFKSPSTLFPPLSMSELKHSGTYLFLFLQMCLVSVLKIFFSQIIIANTYWALSIRYRDSVR